MSLFPFRSSTLISLQELHPGGKCFVTGHRPGRVRLWPLTVTRGGVDAGVDTGGLPEQPCCCCWGMETPVRLRGLLLQPPSPLVDSTVDCIRFLTGGCVGAITYDVNPKSGTLI